MRTTGLILVALLAGCAAGSEDRRVGGVPIEPRVSAAIVGEAERETAATIERIRRILGRDRLTLVGHSFGAFLAAMYAAEFPDRVEALRSVVGA